MKKVLFRLIVLLVLAGGVYGSYRLFQQLPQRQQQVPFTKVRRGDVILRSYSRGELRAVRSATLTAPNLFGTVQVTQLAALGAFAREKDLVAEFDDAEVRSRLEDKQLELEQTGEQIKKSEADLAIRNNQDQVELLRARYAVRRAELEVKRNELISAIDAKKNVLSLEEARRRLTQLESDIKSRRQQAEAELAVLVERKNKSALELERERARLNQVKLLAPISGLVAIKQNRGGFMGMFGMQVPDIREGDQVQPGIPVADVLDLSELEVIARVGELDRANLREGQDVRISLDAIADKTFDGKIKSMSGTASANMFSSDPAKKFDVIFSIDMRQLLKALGAKPESVQRIMATAEQNRRRPPVQTQPSLLAMIEDAPNGTAPRATPSQGNSPGAAARPGTPAGAPAQPGAPAAPGGMPMIFPSSLQFSESELQNAKLPPPPEEDSQLDVLLRPGLLADVEIIVEKVPRALHIPNQAVFEKDGRPIVYVKNGNRYDERPIRIARRSESVTILESGVKENETVALADPAAKPGGDKKKKSDDKGGGGAMQTLPSGGAK